MTLFARIIDLLRAQNAADITVFGGGIIPDADVAELKALGVAQIFGPGAHITGIVAWVTEQFTPRHAA
jgi:methylmalonyl-CoA mutase C-terminal domain/subunit